MKPSLIIYTNSYPGCKFRQEFSLHYLLLSKMKINLNDIFLRNMNSP